MTEPKPTTPKRKGLTVLQTLERIFQETGRTISRERLRQLRESTLTAGTDWGYDRGIVFYAAGIKKLVRRYKEYPPNP